MHIRIVWDGKDSLAFDPVPEWTFQAKCKSHPQFAAITFTKPTNGRFEALVHTPADYLVGTKLEFEVQALGPAGATLNASFTAEVVLPPGPRKVSTDIPARGQRRPPYQLKYVEEKDFDIPSRWSGMTWNIGHAAAFAEPTATQPLTLLINKDFELLHKYMQSLVGKQAAEQRMEEKKTKYISHVAYHLYQMYLHKDDVRKKKEGGTESEELHEPQDDEMQQEINRVASTLIRLMEVMR